MDNTVKNFKIGLASIIACYLAFIFYILTLFLSIEIFGKDNMVYSYILAGFLAAFVLAAGILFLVSLILNISQLIKRYQLKRETKTINLPYGEVEVKIGYYNGKISSVSPEYESCRILALKTGKPLKEVYRDAACFFQ